LTLIAEIYARNGEDLYGLEKDGKSLPLMTNYFISAARAPLIVTPDASENSLRRDGIIGGPPQSADGGDGIQGIAFD
jgi:hypothetical protein